MITKIPIEIFIVDGNGCHIFVDVTLGKDKNGCLIIDTGASQTIISRNIPVLENRISLIDHEDYISYCSDNKKLSDRFSYEQLEEMGADENGILSMAAIPGKVDLRFGLLESFSIGDLTISNFPVGIMDLTNVHDLYHKLNKPNVWGLLGSDFLLKYKATIDYEDEILIVRSIDEKQ